MPRSNATFAAAKPASADAQTLALIASSLVFATIIAFFAMVLTAWPVAAQGGTLQIAALPSSLLQSQTMTETAPQPLIPRNTEAVDVTAPPATAQTASLQSMPLAARPCHDELVVVEAEMNATLARFEALDEQDMSLQCAALRDHLASLSRAAAATDRCTAGLERRTKVNLIRQTAAEWRGVVSSSCR
ncbi:hypothetical protein [Phreatobacter stygius]|uniref:Uncharacterized protein n=1 Tax=Phreatobacter stygius TaxID=1940610 RepID=A0A4D7AVH2_9HYPH|nr:hypothetical protein [Phreatobacter stygius]QCI62978.1 hypothetical protein E8M01_01195 [Phreatobacter stygius]